MKTKLGAILGTLFFAANLLHCTAGNGVGGGNGGGGAAPSFLSLPSGAAPQLADCTAQPLALQPSASWTANAGTINAECTDASGAPSPNPSEQQFDDVATGVELIATSHQEMCCTCTARTRSFKMASTMNVQGTHLTGVFATDRGQNDRYAVSSMRITVLNGGSKLGSRVFAREQRANDNCVGSSELPETVLNDLFDIDISQLATGGAQFDEVRIDLNGYACGNATTGIALVDLRVGTCNTSAPSTPSAPNTPGAPNGPAPSTSTTFNPTGCASSANPNVNVFTDVCPNGVDVSNLPATVTCQVQSCAGAGCMISGTVSTTPDGKQAIANCSATAPVCSSLGHANPQVVVNDRIPCL